MGDRTQTSRLVFVFALSFALVGLAWGQVKAAQAEPSPTLEQREVRKLELEVAKVDIERRRTEILRDAEDRLTRNEPPTWMKVLGVVGTPLSIIGSIFIGFLGYRSQSTATRQQMAAQTEALKAQFRLKGAEIVMNSKSSDEIANKAKALAALFPQDLSGFGGQFKKEEIGISYAMERRQDLIELLAANPAERRRILEAWAVLFPWDAEGWLEPLLVSEKIPLPAKSK